MNQSIKQPDLNFFRYPPIGTDDWRYTYATAQARALQSQMLSKTELHDLANAENFTAAAELLSQTKYALPQNANLNDLENILLQRRTELRAIFKKLIIDEEIIEPLIVREDFANMRLALRRKLTEKPVGVDYSNDGSIPAEDFEKIFEEENYTPLPYHMREAIERAVLAYYQDKDIRQIDYALDYTHFEYKLNRAIQAKHIFIINLFRMQIDINNIKTLLRLKFTESEVRDVFIFGGFLNIRELKIALDADFETIKNMFAHTPYKEIFEQGINYLTENNSFIKLEQKCEEHIAGFLKTTNNITAGPQPIIAYLLGKEAEIRRLRLILTAKKNELEKQLILDRTGN